MSGTRLPSRAAKVVLIDQRQARNARTRTTVLVGQEQRAGSSRSGTRTDPAPMPICRSVSPVELLLAGCVAVGGVPAVEVVTCFVPKPASPITTHAYEHTFASRGDASYPPLEPLIPAELQRLTRFGA